MLGREKSRLLRLFINVIANSAVTFVGMLLSAVEWVDLAWVVHAERQMTNVMTQVELQPDHTVSYH